MSKERRGSRSATTNVPAAPPPTANPGHIERNKGAFELLRRFLMGESGVKDAMAEAFGHIVAAGKAAADAGEFRSDTFRDWNYTKESLGALIVLGRATSNLFVDAFGEEGIFLKGVADDFTAAAKEVGWTIKRWSKDEMAHMLERVDANRAAGAGSNDDPLDFLRVVHTHERKYGRMRAYCGYDRDEGGVQNNPVRSQITEAVRDVRNGIGKKAAERTKPAELTLEERLAAGLGARETAIENDDVDGLQSADKLIAEIEAAIETRDKKAAERTKPAELTLEEKLAEAEALKADAKAKNDSAALVAAMVLVKSVKDRIAERDVAAQIVAATVAAPATGDPADSDKLPPDIETLLKSGASRRLTRLYNEWDGWKKTTAETVVEARKIQTELDAS